MGTSWIEIISDSAMVFIDDIRLQDEAAIDAAQFFRRMSLYVQLAIPMLCRPPELLQSLTNGLTPPDYADQEWVSTTESVSEAATEVPTGLTGFELFSCAVRETDAAGGVSLSPYTQAEYDPETGVVTFPQQAQAGTEYILDFYTDGQFARELTGTQKRLLGLATACVWDERFSRNWLNNQMKIHDQSFSVVNEGTYMKETTVMKGANRRQFDAELWKYEQDCDYMQTTSGTSRNIVLV